jgi:hypothetical protein
MYDFEPEVVFPILMNDAQTACCSQHILLAITLKTFKSLATSQDSKLTETYVDESLAGFCLLHSTHDFKCRIQHFASFYIWA